MVSLISVEIVNPELICSICSGDFLENKAAVYHADGGKKHPFHSLCINSWIFSEQVQEKEPSCPICRKNITRIDPSMFSDEGEKYQFFSHIKDKEKKHEMVVIADSIRVGASKGACDGLKTLDIPWLHEEILDKDIKNHILRIGMTIAAAKGHNTVVKLLSENITP